MSELLVNGPINVLRLEGTVFDIKKVVYIFMDYHAYIHKQTRCPSFTSLDLHQYFASTLKNIQKPIDFMMEIRQEWIDMPKSNIPFKNIYIKEVIDYFKSEFVRSDKSKVLPSKTNKLVRFHYIDIRDYLNNTIYYFEDSIFGEFNVALHNRHMSVNSATNIKMGINNIINELNYWNSILFDDINTINKTTTSNLKRLSRINLKNINSSMRMVPKFVNKIRQKYAHPEVQQKLQNLFNLVADQIKESLKFCYDLVSDIDKYINEYPSPDKLVYNKNFNRYEYGQDEIDRIKFVCNVSTRFLHVSHHNLMIFVNLMDIYFLRRFLDKNYIQNAIVYTGASHSINYIQHLVTQYNFKITHFSYSLETDIDKLNKQIAKEDDVRNRAKIENLLFPKLIRQCSNLSSFPPNFD